MLVLLIGLIISIVIIVYIAKDAPNYGRSPWGWGIFAFFFEFLALGVYLYLTGRKGWGVFWIVVWAAIEILDLTQGRLLL